MTQTRMLRAEINVAVGVLLSVTSWASDWSMWRLMCFMVTAEVDVIDRH